jgi:hypothetical protein
MNRTPENGMDSASAGRVGWLTGRQPLVNQLFADSGAASWGVRRDLFAVALEQSAKKHFGDEAPGAAQIEKYFCTLHLQDLALACACAEGRADAWDYFVSTFRTYLRSAAGAILRCPPDSPAACELADSLFAELYGMSEGANRRSLFRYFHGRSSLRPGCAPSSRSGISTPSAPAAASSTSRARMAMRLSKPHSPQRHAG